jgi:hypothetical protein
MNLSWTGHCLARRRYDERLCRDLQLRGWSCRWCCRGLVGAGADSALVGSILCTVVGEWYGNDQALGLWHVLRGFRVRIPELRLLPGKSLETEHGRLSLRRGTVLFVK